MNLPKIMVFLLTVIFCLGMQISGNTEEKHSKEIANGVYVISDLGFSNCGYIVTDGGVVVVDTTLTPDFAKIMINEIKTITDKPVKYVINTHWHTDHIGGNQAFIPDAQIIGHEFTRKIIAERRAEQDAGKEDETSKMLGADFKYTPPDKTFDKDMTIELGGRTIELKFFKGGHTSGDIVVYIPDVKVFFSGDLFIKGSGMPDYRDDANINNHIESLKMMQELDIDKIICGHLYVAEKKDIQDSLDKLIAFRAEVQKHIDEGLSLEKVIETMKFPAGENPFYKRNFPKVITRVYSVLKGSGE